MFGKTFIALAAVSSAFALTVNSPPALIECQPAQLSWSGGTPPYFLSIIPGGQPSAAPLLQFPETSDTKVTWVVNITAGTDISLSVTGKDGVPNYSSKVTIQKGSETNCAGTISGGSNSTSAASGGAAAGSGASGSGSAGSAPTSGGAAAATGMSGATTGNSGSASGSAAGNSASASGTSKPSSSSSSSSASSSSTSGGALPLAVLQKSTGVMAILGAIAATLL